MWWAFVLGGAGGFVVGLAVGHVVTIITIVNRLLRRARAEELINALRRTPGDDGPGFFASRGIKG